MTRVAASVRISQRFVASSNVAAVTRVRELDVAAEIEPIGDVVEVPLDLGLLRVPTRPLPLLRELLGERVAVVVTLGVAARARIAVPVPRAADAVAGLEDLDAQVQVVAELVERVETGEARADHDHVEVGVLVHRAIVQGPPTTEHVSIEGSIRHRSDTCSQRARAVTPVTDSAEAFGGAQQQVEVLLGPLGAGPEGVDRHRAGTRITPSRQPGRVPAPAGPGATQTLPSRPSASGSRPASAAAVRTASHAGSKPRPGCTGGKGSHPSASRPTRAKAGLAVPHPIQIGTRPAGSGAMPAASTTSDVPA